MGVLRVEAAPGIWRDVGCDSATGPPASQTINYNGAASGLTGTPQDFVVPPRVTGLTVDLQGAESLLGTGGLGGRIYTTIPVVPGETLRIYVGGAPANWEGGWNGGGNGTVRSGSNGGGGGGATDIRRAPYGLADRLAVAGGGGGRGGFPTFGGDGGGLVGETGGEGYFGTPGGTGGTQSAGGTAGGALGIGGNALGPTGGAYGQANGGGGGGYYGGGGGGGGFGEGAGGGGGSSYSAGDILANEQGVRAGHGQAILTWPTVQPGHLRLEVAPGEWWREMCDGDDLVDARPLRIEAPLLVRDDFARADSPASLGSPWVTWSGTWGIEGNRAELKSAAPASHPRVARDVGMSDGVYEATLSNPTAGAENMGVLFRGVNANNFLALDLYVTGNSTYNPNTVGSMLLQRRVNGNESTVASVSVSAWLAGDVVRVELDGPSVVVKRRRAGVTTTLMTVSTSYHLGGTFYGFHAFYAADATSVVLDWSAWDDFLFIGPETWQDVACFVPATDPVLVDPVRVSSVFTEALVLNTDDTRVSSVFAETLIQNTDDTRVSSVFAEVLITN